MFCTPKHKGGLWSGILEGFDSKRDVALPVRPGTYELDAVMRNSDDYVVGSKTNLWHVHRKVTVVEGRDTIIEVR